MTHFVWVIEWIKDGRGFPCLFHLLTGLYCPGCGGTRAIWALLRGDVLKSFCYHPFVLYAVMVMLVEIGYLAAGGGYALWKRRWGREEEGKGQEEAEWKQKVKDGFQRRYARWVMIAVWIVGVNWVVKNGFLLMGVDLLERLGK